MGKKLEFYLRFKESEITFLAEKLKESKRDSRLLEKRLRLNSSESGQYSLSMHTVRTIRSFVKVVINVTRSAGWNLDLAVNMIHPGMEYWKPEHKCFAFESFVCREMFDNFHHPNFSLPNKYECIPLTGHKNKNRNK
ncbi:hypothetical protein Dimus_026175 [Dionaea muscipula]